RRPRRASSAQRGLQRARRARRGGQRPRGRRRRRERPAAAPGRRRRTAAAVTDTARRTESGLRRTQLPNGLTVLSEHVPGVRSVAFGAWVRAASIHESPDRMGVSHLLEHMVFKGTERRSARDIALSLEALGGSLDAYTAREHTSY